MTSHNLDFPLYFQKFRKTPFIITDTGVYSYWETAQCIEYIIHQLQAGHIDKGDYVGLVAELKPETIITILALIQIEAVPVLLNPKLLLQERNNVLYQIGSQSVIATDDIDKDVKDTEHIREISIQYNLKSKSPRQRIHIRPIPLAQVASVMFTSGSSGHPKACVHTLANHYYSALGSNQNIFLKPQDRWLLVLPLHHMGGLSIIFRSLLAGAALVIPKDINAIADAALKHNISHISLVPTQLYRLLYSDRHTMDWPGLKAVLVGGDKLNSGLVKRSLVNKIPLHTTYGCTEMASQVTTTPVGASETVLKTCGKILPHRQLKIDASGEILVRGKTLFSGYLQQGKMASGADKDGWYHTGDIGWLDTNDCLHVIGRKDNMFICGGENIYPEEIERALLAIDYIEKVLVVGVKDKEYGHIPVAFVSFSSMPVPLAKITNALSDHIPRFYLPKKILKWPTKQTVDLKPDRKMLTQMAESIISEKDA
jgi:O-succinylbenzoic acid--CoA ligase